MPAAGELRHKVKIQQFVETQNDFGEVVQTWQDFATVWASIEPLSGREYFSAKQVQSEISSRIRMRYLAGVKSTMRVLFGARIFNILSVINLEERNQELQLMCQEAL